MGSEGEENTMKIAAAADIDSTAAAGAEMGALGGEEEAIVDTPVAVDDETMTGNLFGSEGGRRRSRKNRGAKKGKTRKGNKMLSSWVAFVKKVQREENISYSDAMKRASARKKEWKRGQTGGEGVDGEIMPSMSNSMGNSMSNSMGKSMNKSKSKSKSKSQYGGVSDSSSTSSGSSSGSSSMEGGRRRRKQRRIVKRRSSKKRGSKKRGSRRSRR